MKQVLISMRSQQHGGSLSVSQPELETDGVGTAVHRPKALKSTDEEQYNYGPKPTVFVSFTHVQSLQLSICADIYLPLARLTLTFTEFFTPNKVQRYLTMMFFFLSTDQ